MSSTPEPHESESNDDSIELASSQSYDDLQSLSARLRSLQGVAATGPADRNHHNMSRLLGEAADEDAADEIEENEYGDELAVANDDSDDDQPTQQEVSAEIDAILKGAAETFDAATLVPEHDHELLGVPRFVGEARP